MLALARSQSCSRSAHCLLSLPIQEAEDIEQSGDGHDPLVELSSDSGLLLLGPGELFLYTGDIAAVGGLLLV